MMINKLELNGNKTELLVLNAFHRPTPTLNSIYAGTDHITHPINISKKYWCLVRQCGVYG